MFLIHRKTVHLHRVGSMDGLFFLIAVVVVAKSPIGRAIADRIAGRTGPPSAGHQELESLEHRVDDRFMDLEERMEFVERMIEQQRARNELPPLK